eukprot:TRINITY_DN3084_c0_g1_i1.p1 TRINITY_DN3084_c0_g1~~TRINITY_DN3084_c0_g1_i1.p1  ORF type:complete len:580 (+),score=122.60 TRINITY_DN3084_c0_g1_i1:102-1841(+)
MAQRLTLTAIESRFKLAYDDTPPMFSGESVCFRNHNVTLIIESGIIQIRGTLVLTNIRLFFMAYENSSRSPKPVDRVKATLPYTAINRLSTYSNLKNGNDQFYLQIIGKDFSFYTFCFPKQQTARDTVYSRLLLLTQPTSIILPCILMGPDNVALGCGYALHDSSCDYERTGLLRHFRLCDNLDFHLSPTYPSQFVVPSSFSDMALQEVANFRSTKRIPAGVWRHPNGASLWRCSQPNAGLFQASELDESYLYTIQQTGLSSKALFILDCRPKAYAMANSLKGKGYEGSSYRNCQVWFAGIGNIHDVTCSWERMHEAFFPPMVNTQPQDMGNLGDSDSRVQPILAPFDLTQLSVNENFLVAVQASGWLKHVQLILSASRIGGHLLHQGHSVVVHCSDGWDRTSQVSALIQLLVDPFYRTIRGFAMLLEREWVSFGHKFMTRSGTVLPIDGKFVNLPAKQASPIFPLFMDCVFQLIHQFPSAFEFNNTFIMDILEKGYFYHYSGTFLYDNDQERFNEGVYMTTSSLWSILNLENYKYLNLLYVPTKKMLQVALNTRNFTIWTDFYGRILERKKHAGKLSL